VQDDHGLVVAMTQRVQRPAQRSDRAATLDHTAALARQHVLLQRRHQVAVATARAVCHVLIQVHDILQQRPDLGVLPNEAAKLRAKVDMMRGVTLGASSLTTAELRLLPLLATHLSYPQIGERLHLSRHTVKLQKASRKAGTNLTIEGSSVLPCPDQVGNRQRRGDVE
jgi:ATP/maltotriose-dependent transcriptional regulator MalT